MSLALTAEPKRPKLAFNPTKSRFRSALVNENQSLVLDYLHTTRMLCQIHLDLFSMITPASKQRIVVDLKCDKPQDVLFDAVILQSDVLDTLP
jgi:hypothetical protein